MNKVILLAGVLFSASSFANSEPGVFINVALGHSSFEGKNAVQRGTNQANTPVDGYAVDNGNVFGLGLGYRFGNGFAVQIEYRTREFETDNRPLSANPDGLFAGNTFQTLATADTESLMINGIYEFTPGSGKLKPYIKAGVGLARHDVHAELDIQPFFATFDFSSLTACPGEALFCYPDKKSDEFAWSVGAGISYLLTESMALGIDYQYIDMNSAETAVDPLGDQVIFPEITAHEITANFSYTF
ncbi:porin family protein [Thalassomonas sp. RHCl1]|uniref:outer membrane protein n=1 Tax=Thalassomonas sp. RHCl1 TaxID=2995320 RepID=UPI00248CFECC|nr:porin family protein [Thalassomonas sp. RHCl1]